MAPRSSVTTRWWALAIIVLSQGAQTGATEVPEFRFGFSGGTLSKVDLRDAQAALEFWLNRVSQTMDVGLQPVVRAYADDGLLSEAVEGGGLDAIAMTALELV